MILLGFLTFIGFLLLFLKLSPRTLKRMVGAGFATDLGLTVFFLVLFGFTATFSGMIVGIIAGLLLSVALLFAKWFMPHEEMRWKRGRPVWVEVKPNGWKRFQDWLRPKTCVINDDDIPTLTDVMDDRPLHKKFWSWLNRAR